MIMHLPIVILLTLLVRALARCPNELLLEPCKCSENHNTSYIRCENFGNSDDLQKVFDNSLDYPFDSLTLGRCTLPHLHSTWISTKRIKALFVDGTTMIDLIDDIDSTLPSITHIIIGWSKLLRRVRWQQFRPFTQLTSLAISDTEVKKLGKEFRNNVSSRLKLVSIMRARVKVLKEGAFKGKTELYSIQFQSNRIKVLKKSFFEDQKAVLSFVDFSFNPIESIPEDLFDGLQSLKIVTFQGTHLKTLSKLLNFGEYLNLMDTPLVCDCEMAWIPEKIDSFVLDGSCVSPPDLKSKQLKFLTKSDFSACDSE